VRASLTPELSALGAALFGALGMSMYDKLDSLQQIPSGFTEYKPSMQAPQAKALISGWKRAVYQILSTENKGKNRET
jgi:glycerol kinase